MSLRRLATAGLALILGAAVLGVFTAHRDHLEATSSRRPLTGRVGQLIPDYPGTAFFPMGRALHVDGLPREMAYAVTDDEPAKVADRYEAIWESQGYEVDRQDGEVESWVTARASEDPWVRSIVISRSGRRTTIIASVSGADAHGSAPRVPVPDYCDVVQHTGATDIGIDTQAVMLNCEGYARQVGLDLAKWKSMRDNRRSRLVVAADKREGLRAGVKGTPTFYFNGKQYKGRKDYTELRDRIEEELNLVKGGR